jgi:hypothetical protein
MPIFLAEGQHLEVFQAVGLKPYLDAWIALVGTRWLPHQVLERLAGAWIPCLFQGDELVATCVLRPKGLWILETLHARKGFGTPFLRSMVVWLYKHDGPFSLGYTWELSLAGLVGAWTKGWLASANQIQYGWSWSLHTSCSFCSKESDPRFVVPVVIQTEKGIAIVSDSGLRDGWGTVLAYRGDPDWALIAREGRWISLWMRASRHPSGWIWTGEIVVVGVLNPIHGSYDKDDKDDKEWITAEI